MLSNYHMGKCIRIFGDDTRLHNIWKSEDIHVQINKKVLAELRMDKNGTAKFQCKR